MNELEDPSNLDPRLLGEKDEPLGAKLDNKHVPFWFAWLLWFVGLSLVVALAGPDFFSYDNAQNAVPWIIVGILIGSLLLALATVKVQRWRKE